MLDELLSKSQYFGWLLIFLEIVCFFQSPHVPLTLFETDDVFTLMLANISTAIALLKIHPSVAILASEFPTYFFDLEYAFLFLKHEVDLKSHLLVFLIKFIELELIACAESFPLSLGIAVKFGIVELFAFYFVVVDGFLFGEEGVVLLVFFGFVGLLTFEYSGLGLFAEGLVFVFDFGLDVLGDGEGDLTERVRPRFAAVSYQIRHVIHGLQIIHRITTISHIAHHTTPSVIIRENYSVKYHTV